MKLTDNNKVEYYRNRIDEKFESMEKTFASDLNQIAEWVEWINLNHEKINRDMQVTFLALKILQTTCKTAKVKKKK